MRPLVWRHNSGPVVSSWASGLCRVRVLVGPECTEFPGQPFGHRVVARGILGLDGHRAHDDLGAVRLEQGDLLGRHLVGHHEDAPVPALGGDDGEPDAGVAARRLDDRAAGLEHAVEFGGEDHLERGPVLRRAARVGRLGLEGEHTADALVRMKRVSEDQGIALCARPQAGDDQPRRLVEGPAGAGDDPRRRARRPAPARAARSSSRRAATPASGSPSSPPSAATGACS